jgi:hypothetical protein
MSILNYPEGVPSRVLGLVRLLAQTHTRTASREDLVAIMSPPGLRALGEAPGNQVRNAFGVAIDLGLLAENGDDLLLDPDLDRKRASTPDGLAEIILFRLLAGTDDKFLHVVAWSLDEDPYGRSISWASADQSLSATYGDERFGLNDVHFSLAFYWMAFLGLARRVESNAFVPDPTSAMRRVLQRLLKKKARTPLTALRDTLAVHAPIFEGGRWRSTVRAARQHPFPESGFGLSTSMALLRLHEAGDIHLEMKADGEPVTMLDAGGLMLTRSMIERLR